MGLGCVRVCVRGCVRGGLLEQPPGGGLFWRCTCSEQAYMWQCGQGVDGDSNWRQEWLCLGWKSGAGQGQLDTVDWAGSLCGHKGTEEDFAPLLIRSRHTSPTLCGGCVVGCGQSVVASHTWPAPWLQGPATKLWHQTVVQASDCQLISLQPHFRVH